MLNAHKIFVTTGASNHSRSERSAGDLYVTDPRALEMLLEHVYFSAHIWEPACGLGHLSEVLKNAGHRVYSSDICSWGYEGQNAVVDFLSDEALPQPEQGLLDCDIVTNPPYTQALEFAQQALSIVKDGCKVALFLRLQFLEGKKRRAFFEEHPPRQVWVFSSRMNCLKPAGANQKSSAICYAWFVWIKGFRGSPELRWL